MPTDQILNAFAEARRTWDDLVALQPDIRAARGELSTDELAELEKRVGVHDEQCKPSMSAVAIHTKRIGQVYSALMAGRFGVRRAAAAIIASIEHASAARDSASAPLTKTTSVSKCWVWPKLWGRPIKYVPSANATAIAGLLKKPIALRNSETFHIACSHASVVGETAGNRSVSKSQTGRQKTSEYAPHGVKS